MANQINTHANLVKLVAATPMLAKVGTLEAAAEGFVKDHPSRQVASVMSEVFEDVNYKKNATGQPKKDNLIRTLVKQLNEVLAAKVKPAPEPEPEPKGFNLADYLADVEAAPVAAPVAKPVRKLTPQQAKIAELERQLAALKGRPGTVDLEPVKAKVGQAKRYRGKLSVTIRIDGDGYDLSEHGIRQWEERKLVDATLTASQRKAAIQAVLDFEVEIKELRALLGA